MKDRLTFKNATAFLRGLIGVDILGFKVERMPGDGNHRSTRWRLAEISKGRHQRFASFNEAVEEFAEDDETIFGN